MAKHAPRGPVKVHEAMESDNPMEAVRAVRCKATNRAGKQCGRRPIPGGTVCVMHGGKAPQVQAAAQERLKALQPLAIQVLEKLMLRDEFPTVQLGAARDVIDRTEGKPTERVEQKHSGTLRLIHEGM